MKSKHLVSAVMLLASVLLLNTDAYSQRINNLVNFSIFSDKQAFDEGDVVTILLMEFTEGKNTTETNTDSDSRITATATTSGLMEDMIPTFGLNNQLANRSDNKGETTSRGTLQGKISAIVTEVAENGLLTIQGTKVVNVNGEKQTTVLTGIVRPEDVHADNTVFSYNIANAQISYSGKGGVTSAGKPGFITRIWNWIF